MLFNIKIKELNNLKILNSIFYKITESIVPEEPREQYGFNILLNNYRNKIDKINPETWKKIRWYINYYDFLVKDPIINRAFYKYWEIINIFQIFKDYNTEEDAIFHCAEAPGGFIQGTNIFLQLDHVNEQQKTIVHEENNYPDSDGFIQVKSKRKQKNIKNYKIYTISLNKDLPQYKNYNLPSYNKRVINKNICISYGRDNTGDINNLENINYIKNCINKVYLITADGGFDEGTDFNNKEQLHYYLILNEIYSAIALQKQSGHFILKVFDIFTNTSMHLLYLLSLLYEDVFIYKPKTSRPTNSEKYVICKNFKCEQDTLDKITNVIFELSKTLKSMKKNKYNSFELFEEIPLEFINRVKHINNYYIDRQCTFLEKAIKLCENTNFIDDYENQLNSSLEERKNTFKQWENKYNLNNFIPS